MAAVVTVEGNKLLDASLGTTTYVATVTPVKCRLMTANGSGTSAGTEVTGGTYTTQTVTFGAAASLTATASGTLTFTLMPACTVTGVELWDSNGGGALRKWWGALSANKTVNAGDTFSLTSLTVSFT
jgi:hypothetical protein